VITRKAHPIIVPQAWDQHFSTHPGGNPNSGQNNNPLRQARENIKHILSHYAHNKTSVTAVLKTTDKLKFIAVGPQAVARNPQTALGIPGGGLGAGPPSRFIGRGGNATLIVYIIDNSGDMLYNWGIVRREMRRSVQRLVAYQRFAVILVGDGVRQLGAAGLAHATVPVRNSTIKQFLDVPPRGSGQGRLAIYEEAFRRAFKLHPQLIYFVTNGGFDPELANVVKKLNARGNTRVFTYTFLYGGSKAFLKQVNFYAPTLKEIAKETGGQYKLVKE
ncbi:MAG: hypothetical protein ACP5VQ_05575, partial [Phycisphaerae bacterium]